MFWRKNSLFCDTVSKCSCCTLHVSEKEFSIPCESYTPRECRRQRDLSCKRDRHNSETLLYCVNYFIHFLPLIKRNAVYQSYYIHTNGHTIAVNHFVVNKSLKQVLFFPFLSVWGLFYCGRKCRRAGHHSFETKPN